MQTITNTFQRPTQVIDLRKLPEMAQQELFTFYEFLVFKYQGYDIPAQQERRAILNAIFQEAAGKLPPSYTFDRAEIHER